MKINQSLTATLFIAGLLIHSGCTSPQQPQPTELAEQSDTPQEIAVKSKEAVPAKNQGITPQPARLYSESKQTLQMTDSDMAQRGRVEKRLAAPAASFVPEALVPVLGGHNTESYSPVGENRFINSLNDPLSTFSIDVDTASYANIRRFINNGSLPPSGAVRIEELINYFDYDYPATQDNPLALHTELGPCPWQPDNRLLKIGLQAKKLPAKELPPSNIVFLIDVSGSMNHPDKLPLLQQSMLMLVEQLEKKDRVAIVVYAGSNRVVLPPTPADRKEAIVAAIQQLNSGGSTHASGGILKAYDLAEQSFMPGGNNRVILASDGDFNVGVTTRGELEKLISAKRELGIYLTVLGFGMGNYHDDTMEILADNGNGNYAYIDSLLEAKKVLLRERASNLYTLAGDVKIQVEFNPAVVGGYRLIGYENRVLADEDFNDDSKDAGEIGLGHSVTALYELIPAGTSAVPTVDGLRYGSRHISHKDHQEVASLKLRYKPFGSSESKLINRIVKNSGKNLEFTSADFRFTSSVAAFGMQLTDSPLKGDTDWNMIVELARGAKGEDRYGYRAEFIRLAETAQLLTR